MLSTFQYITNSTVENDVRKNNGTCSNTRLANADILRNSDENADSTPDTCSETKNTVTTSGNVGYSQDMGQIGPSYMSFVRRSYEKQRIPKNVTDILLSSWRPSTSKQYDSYLKRWEEYCDRRKINSFYASVNDVMMFLTELYESDIGYSGINTAKSALSNVVVLSDCQHVSVGQHPVIKRFLKGVFNKRPALPRYHSVWDVSQVLEYLRKIDLDGISLKSLTLKTCMLLALLSGQRVQTLKALSIGNMLLTDSEVEFQIDVLLKQSRPGKHLSCISFKKYTDERLCVIAHPQQYVSKTKDLRTSDNLLISYQKPFKPVTTETISRWLKTVLTDSGINTDVYSAHSVRSASSSAAAMMGCPIDSIMKQIGWSNAKTFAMYYNKPMIAEMNIGQTVLQSMNKS